MCAAIDVRPAARDLAAGLAAEASRGTAPKAVRSYRPDSSGRGCYGPRVTWRSYLVGLPPLVLAVAGLAHPMVLTPETSRHWTTLHVALIPVFPLLGGCLWLLLRRENGSLAVAARVAAFVYACFYTALDAVNGVAVGMFVHRAAPAQAASQTEVLRPVLDLGNALGWLGSGAFLLAAVLAGAVVVRRHGRRAVSGAVLTVMASVSFLDSHIYWPRGVITMTVLAVGLVLLARAGESARRSRDAGGRPRGGGCTPTQGRGLTQRVGSAVPGWQSVKDDASRPGWA